MEKEFLNWSKARLWSPGHNFTGDQKNLRIIRHSQQMMKNFLQI